MAKPRKRKPWNKGKLVGKKPALTVEEVHAFLATIGQSSKRESLNRDDFIGQFGIGLLSAFAVTASLPFNRRGIRLDRSGYHHDLLTDDKVGKHADAELTDEVLRSESVALRRAADRGQKLVHLVGAEANAVVDHGGC